MKKLTLGKRGKMKKLALGKSPKKDNFPTALANKNGAHGWSVHAAHPNPVNYSATVVLLGRITPLRTSRSGIARFSGGYPAAHPCRRLARQV
jgi:hypothetical protein